MALTSGSTSMRQPASPSRATEVGDGVFGDVFAYVQRIAPTFLRVSLGVILFWIGALKYFHPAPIVGLLQASFLLRFLASNGFVYLLGTLEIVAAVLLLGNIAVRYVALLAVLLFAGTLTIFVTAPAITYGAAGFPNLSLAGQFLLKDLVLAGAALMVCANDVARHAHEAPQAVAALRAEMSALQQRMQRLEQGR